MPKSYKKRNLLDLGILVPYLILSIIGLMMVYSTTSYVMLEEGSNPARQAILQFVFWVISLFMMIVIYKMKTSFLKKSWLINGAMVLITIALGAAFLFKPVNGAYGWIQIPSIGTVQPVEFLKFIVIWFLAIKLSGRQNHISVFQ